MTSSARIRGADLQPGCPVVACDGKHLGKVKEISGSYFKVDAPMARDYWLKCESIISVDPGEVRMNFTRDVLGEYRLKHPGIEPHQEPYLDAAGDGLISDDEMAEQRERMERELSRQRRNLGG